MITREIHHIEEIYNTRTLNIFSDASTRRGPNLTTAACYESIAVCQDNVLEKLCRIHSDTTSNQEELRGIRGSIRLALKYYQNFETINLFSDSDYSIRGLKNFSNYRYDDENNTIYIKGNKELMNQSLFIENAQLLLKLIHVHPDVNLYFVKAHIDMTNIFALRKAANKFTTLNRFRNKDVDLNLIRYITTYNNMADKESRTVLRTTNVYNNYYSDPVQFFALCKIRL